MISKSSHKAIEPKEAPDSFYEPRGAAKKLWKCREPEILYEGPAGTGKSRADLERVLAQATKYPGSRHLLCRKTRASMTESVLVTFENKVLPPGSPILRGPQRRLRQSYTVPCPGGGHSEIIIGGLDKPERTFSTEYDTIIVFEAIETTLNDYELLLRALRNNVMPYQQIIAETNPGPSGHWLNQRAKENKMFRLKSKHEDNPVYWDQGRDKWTRKGIKYIEKLDAMSGARKLRLRFGKWASADGSVYPEYDPQIHVIDRFQIPREWRRIRSCDFGYTNPFVCQWWAIDPDDIMYMYKEIYFSNRLMKKHVRTMMRHSEGEEYEATVVDHDPEARKIMEAAGIETTAAYKDVETGIDAVNSRLKVRGNGKARLYHMRDSLIELDEYLVDEKRPTQTTDEYDGYVFKRDKEGRIDKEEPVKRDDHGMDGTRYAVAYVDDLPWGKSDPEEEMYAGGAELKAA